MLKTLQKTPLMGSALVLLTMLSSMAATAATSVVSTQAKVSAALASDVRSAEERARDGERKPAETLAFFGLKDDMSVLELFPGRGWYTKILGNVLKDNGQLTLALGLSYMGNSLEDWGYGYVKKIPDTNAVMNPTAQRGIFDLTKIDLPKDTYDMVLTFRNAHNMTVDARRKLDTAVLAALKPGGIYGVIDHTRRHMEPFNEERWRRLDPVEVILEATQAGFEFVGYSDLHRNPDDGLVYDSTHESLNRYSDRFTLKFRKPQ